LSRVVSDHREDIYVQPGDAIPVVPDPQTFIADRATGRETMKCDRQSGMIASASISTS
jgi:hypothetical protein